MIPKKFLMVILRGVLEVVVRVFVTYFSFSYFILRLSFLSVFFSYFAAGKSRDIFIFA